jgi:hypothetical protein
MYDYAVTAVHYVGLAITLYGFAVLQLVAFCGGAFAGAAGFRSFARLAPEIKEQGRFQPKGRDSLAIYGSAGLLLAGAVCFVIGPISNELIDNVSTLISLLGIPSGVGCFRCGLIDNVSTLISLLGFGTMVGFGFTAIRNPVPTVA